MVTAMANDELATMRAAVVTRYGGPEVVAVRQVRRPQPGPHQVLIQVKASAVSSGDARLRARRVPAGMGLLVRLALGWSAPRQPVLGTECAGVVVAVGPGVTRFHCGDSVMAFPGIAMGAHATHLCIREDGPIAAKPAELTWNEAASLLFGGMTAIHYLHHEAALQPGERVLVLGASGAVGVAAVQIARHAGADVTAVCSAANAALVLGLGAARVIDYATQDFRSAEHTSAPWDVVMDCVGATNYAHCRRVLAPGGRLLRVVCGLAGQLAAPFQGRLSGHRVIAGVAAERLEDLQRCAQLARTGAYRPVIDGVLPLSAIAQAHARVDSGRKRGSLVISMEDEQ